MSSKIPSGGSARSLNMDSGSGEDEYSRIVRLNYDLIKDKLENFKSVVKHLQTGKTLKDEIVNSLMDKCSVDALISYVALGGKNALLSFLCALLDTGNEELHGVLFKNFSAVERKLADGYHGASNDMENEAPGQREGTAGGVFEEFGNIIVENAETIKERLINLEHVVRCLERNKILSEKASLDVRAGGVKELIQQLQNAGKRSFMIFTDALKEANNPELHAILRKKAEALSEQRKNPRESQDPGRPETQNQPGKQSGDGI